MAVITFSRDEYGKLYDFVTAKKLQVKNIGGGKKIVSEMDFCFSLP
jgi:hypothetical protein